MTLNEEASRATDLLEGKIVSRILRNRAKELLVEFTDGTRFFVDHVDDALDLSITGGVPESMSSNQPFLQKLYDAFNRREVETIIGSMAADVKWANGLTGGFVYGRDAVREYWKEQFKSILPELETLGYETDADGRDVVTVHQVVKDLDGNVLADATVHQIFTIKDGLISLYEIGETVTIEEMIEQARTAGE